MPPPVSFIEISSVPFSQVVTQVMFNVANEQWFKYIAAVPIVLGLQTSSGGTFNPRVQIYESDGTTVYGPNQIGDGGWWLALRIAADYYIKVTRSASGASDFDFTFTADTRPLDVITTVPGDLIVNDDANTAPNGFPAIVVSSAGVTKFFVSAIPSGEFGAILPSNVTFWHDVYGRLSLTNRIAIFNASLGYITSVTCGLTGSTVPAFAIDITNSKVYVRGGSNQLWTISSAGVATNTGYVFPEAGPYPEVMAVNPTGTILYWANVHNNLGTIHALNLTTLVALSDLYTPPSFVASTDRFAATPNNHAGDMFVMPNGNIVTWWLSYSASIYHLVVLNSTGTLLYNHDYVYPSASLDHLAYIDGDSDHIMAWWYTNSGFSVGRYGRLNLATGIVDQDFTNHMFSEGFNLEGTDKFGPSSSCTFVRIQGVSSVDTSGIYYINPVKATRHDSYYNSVEKKIPNPTIRTGLIGE